MHPSRFCLDSIRLFILQLWLFRSCLRLQNQILYQACVCLNIVKHLLSHSPWTAAFLLLFLTTWSPLVHTFYDPEWGHLSHSQGKIWPNRQHMLDEMPDYKLIPVTLPLPLLLILALWNFYHELLQHTLSTPTSSWPSDQCTLPHLYREGETFQLEMI